MTSLVVRKIPWDFDATVPFMWQPANPNFGLFCNAFTFIAVPFERYIVAAVRKAADQLNQDSADQPLPDWADTWMREYGRGTNMTTFFGAPPSDAPTAER